MLKFNAFFVLFACLLSSAVHAYLDAEIDKKILDATKSDTSRSDKDKLFKNRCDTIKQYVGFQNDTTGQARQYSCSHTAVGITLFAGKDLGAHSPESVGQYFISELKKRNVNAQIFIKHDHEYGSSMAFYINGRTWLNEPISPLEGIKDIDFLANEAKLILLNEKGVDSWPDAPK